MADVYVEINEAARNLYRNFTPGPITIVSKLKNSKTQKLEASEKNKTQKKLAKGVASELGTVGVRIPDYPPQLRLIKKFGRPITATSANASYKKRPYKIADILENISEKQKALIDLIVDVGELPHREPSTVIDTTLDDPVVLRQGSLMFNDQCSVFSRNEENTQNVAKELWQKYEQYAGQRAIVFALQGEMGAGKTQFVKGLARAMGITEEVTSPTYGIEESYLTPVPSLGTGEGKLFLKHIDTWRMQTAQELEDLGIKNMINDKSVIAIEWADRVAEVIRKYNEEAIVIWVKIDYGDGQNERRIAWNPM